MKRSSNLVEILRDIVVHKRVLIVCIGNRIRGDDGVGSYIGDKLVKANIGDVLNVESSLENYLSRIANKKPEIILLIDAIDAGLKPGAIIIGSIEELKERVSFMTTHNIPITLLMRFLKDVFQMRDVKVYLLGIQVKEVGIFEKISHEVKTSADYIVDLLKGLLILKAKRDCLRQNLT